MGSTAIGIPIGSHVAASPFETSAISLSWSSRMILEVEIKMEG